MSSSTLNSPAPKSILRQPRGFVMINGISVPWEKFEINNTRYKSAGTFRIMIPVSTLPKTLPLSLLVSSSVLTVQVNAGLPTNSNVENITASDVPMLIMGNADNVTYEPEKTLVTITGRDYVALFLDNKINQLNNPIGPQISSAFNSSTSSQLVTLIASHRGLTPIVTATSQPLGTALPGGNSSGLYSQLSNQITEWDFMVYLARQEGYDLFVQGKNLYFQPLDTSNPYQITLTIPFYTTSGQIETSNAVSIQLNRNLRLATDIVVQVSSWNINDKMTYNALATLRHTGSSRVNPPIIYNYRLPNLSQSQCTAKAQSLLAEISQHEMQLNVRMPADTLLTAHGTILVMDTNSLYDQTYYVKNIMREMDFNGGFIMHIEAKTSPPSTIVVAAQ